MRDETQTMMAQIGATPVEIGRFTYGVEGLQVYEWGEGARLIIGSFCSLADNIKFVMGGNHRMDWVTLYPFGHIYQNHLGGDGIRGHPTTKGDIILGHDVWIARDVTIHSGVTIGNGAVVAAGSVVTKSIGPFEIWGGNPARFIKHRFDLDITERLQALAWWELPVETVREIAPLLSVSPTPDGLHEIERIAAQARAVCPPFEDQELPCALSVIGEKSRAFGNEGNQSIP